MSRNLSESEGYQPLVDILLAALVGLGIAIPLAARRHDTLGYVLVALLLTVGTAWVLNWVVIATDFHDADGFMDCWPYCSTWQEVVNRTFWYGGLLFVALVIAVVADAAWRGLRSRSR
jgi:hypothetical protein